MAMEPINVFSRRIDPQGVLASLRSLNADLAVVGPDDAWREATLTVQRPDGEAWTLTFRHNPDYYDGADWPQQMLGMQGYFSRFPDCERKADVLRMIGTFRFALATEWTPDLNASGDERLGALFAVAERLDGALFTPSAMRDRRGRILLAADGETDPEAVLPLLPEGTAFSLDDDRDADEVEDEGEEPDPPSAERVARRALSLTAVAARALAEQFDSSTERVEVYRQAVVSWVDALDLENELEPDEWKVLQRPVGRLDRQATVDSTWRLEGLGVLAWALGRFDLPSHDTLVDPQRLLNAMCLLDDSQAERLSAEPRLRPLEELDAMRKRLLAVHWRLRDYSLRPSAMDFADFAKNCWFGPFDVSSIRLVDGDLALGKSAIADANEDLFSIAFSAALERHRAINWLVWGGRTYSETDTST